MGNNYGTITDKNDPNFGRMRASVISRAMGFLRPISFFNTGKKQEFEDRKLFKESKSLKKEKAMPCGRKKGGKK